MTHGHSVRRVVATGRSVARSPAPQRCPARRPNRRDDRSSWRHHRSSHVERSRAAQSAASCRRRRVTAMTSSATTRGGIHRDHRGPSVAHPCRAGASCSAAWRWSPSARSCPGSTPPWGRSPGPGCRTVDLLRRHAGARRGAGPDPEDGAGSRARCSRWSRSRCRCGRSSAWSTWWAPTAGCPDPAWSSSSAAACWRASPCDATWPRPSTSALEPGIDAGTSQRRLCPWACVSGSATAVTRAEGAAWSLATAASRRVPVRSGPRSSWTCSGVCSRTMCGGRPPASATRVSERHRPHRRKASRDAPGGRLREQHRGPARPPVACPGSTSRRRRSPRRRPGARRSPRRGSARATRCPAPAAGRRSRRRPRRPGPPPGPPRRPGAAGPAGTGR